MYIRNWQRSWVIITLFSLFTLLTVSSAQAVDIDIQPPTVALLQMPETGSRLVLTPKPWAWVVRSCLLPMMSMPPFGTQQG